MDLKMSWLATWWTKIILTKNLRTLKSVTLTNINASSLISRLTKVRDKTAESLTWQLKWERTGRSYRWMLMESLKRNCSYCCAKMQPDQPINEHNRNRVKEEIASTRSKDIEKFYFQKSYNDIIEIIFMIWELYQKLSYP